METSTESTATLQPRHLFHAEEAREVRSGPDDGWDLRAQLWSMGSFCFRLSLHHPKVSRISISVVTLGPRGGPTVTEDRSCSWPLSPEFRGHTSVAPALQKAGGEMASRLQNAAARDWPGAQCALEMPQLRLPCTTVSHHAGHPSTATLPRPH